MDPISLSAFNQLAALANVADADRVVLSHGGVGLTNLQGLSADERALSQAEVAEQNAAVRQALFDSVSRFVEQNGAFDPNGEVVANLRSLIGESEAARAKDLTAKDLRNILTAMRTADVAFDANVRTAEALDRTDHAGYAKFFALVDNSGKSGADIAALLGKPDDARFATVFEEIRRVPDSGKALGERRLAELAETLGDMSDLAMQRISTPAAGLSADDLDFLEALQTASFKMALELDAVAEKVETVGTVEQADVSFTRRALAFNTAFARLEAEAAAGRKDLAAFKEAVTRLSDEIAAFKDVDANASYVADETNPVACEIIDRIGLIDDRLAELQNALADDSNNAFLSELVAHRQNDFVGMLMDGEISPGQYLELRAQGYSAEMILKGAVLNNVTDNLGSGQFNTVVKQDASIDLVHKSREFAVKDESWVSPGCAAAFFLGLSEDLSGAKLNFAACKLAKTVGSGHVLAENGIALDGGTLKICMEVVKGENVEKILDKFEQPTSGFHALFHPDPNDGKAVARAEKLRLQLVSGLNRLAWADAFSGEVDRHLGNIIVNIDQENETVDVVGIDNEQGFAPNCQGLAKAVYSQEKFDFVLKRFRNNRARFQQYVRDVLNEPFAVSEKAFLNLFTKNADGTYSPNFSHKLTASENYLLGQTCGINSCRTPAFIMKDQLDRILDLDKRIAAWRKGAEKDNLAEHPLVKELRPLLSTGRSSTDTAILKAIVSRADSVIAHAKKLKSDGLVIHGDAQHKAADLKVMKRVAGANKAQNDIDCYNSLDLAEILLKRLV